MREMGITGICPGPNLSRRNAEHQIYPYLLRNVTAAYPNHVWGIDITYIRLHGGWLYLVAVIDWFSRYVISWELDQTLEMPFVLAAVERALAQASPLIWNSDQGSHFTSPQYTQLLLAGRRADQHGWQRAGERQHLHRTALAYHQVRRSLPEGLRQPERGAPAPWPTIWTSTTTGGAIRRWTIGHPPVCTVRYPVSRNSRPGTRDGRTNVSLGCGQVDNCSAALTQLPTCPQPLLRLLQRLLRSNPNSEEETVP